MRGSVWVVGLALLLGGYALLLNLVQQVALSRVALDHGQSTSPANVAGVTARPIAPGLPVGSSEISGRSAAYKSDDGDEAQTSDESVSRRQPVRAATNSSAPFNVRIAATATPEARLPSLPVSALAAVGLIFGSLALLLYRLLPRRAT